jgi:DNA-directed RNA polymerase beta' subunit
MGHITLVVPVAHIWYFRSLPNKIGYLLGLPTKKLDQIIYYERYVVIQPGTPPEQARRQIGVSSNGFPDGRRVPRHPRPDSPEGQPVPG